MKGYLTAILTFPRPGGKNFLEEELTMKMIHAVVRPENETAVASALAKANFPALTKWDVVGRGKQQGI